MNNRNRRRSYIALSILFIALILFCREDKRSPVPTTTTMTSADAAGATMTVHFIDVGQGDCTLVESNGRYLLIDAGENDQADVVIQYLKKQQVNTLDYVIGTHPHSDHIGGLDRVIDTFDTRNVIIPPQEHTTRSYRDLLNVIADNGLTIISPVMGSTFELGSASFQIISPAKDYGDDLNNWSVGIRLSCGSTAFVLCGDAGKEAETDMCSSGLNLRADVLKLGHHGSYSSTCNDFLDAVRPSYAVAECGSDNPYGYPHDIILNKLDNRGIELYRTDKQGTITAFSDGSTITWHTTEEP